MKELPSPQKLLKRNGVYYFRTRVPLELVQILGCKEIKISLGTKDLKEAKQRLNLEQVKADERFTTARRKLNANTNLEPSRATQSLTKTEADRLILLWHKEKSKKYALIDDSFLIDADDEEILNFIDTLRDDLTALHGTPAEYASSTQRTVRQVLNLPELSYLTDPALFGYAEKLIRQSLIQLANDRLERTGIKKHRPDFAFFIQGQSYATAATVSNEASSLRWSELLERFREAKTRDGMTAKTLSGYRLTFDFSTELFGAGKAIDTIKPADCRDFRDTLSTLPSNARKRYPNIKLLDTIPLHKSRPDQHLSAVSVNGHLVNLSAILNFALKEGYITKNPAAHIPRLKTSTDDSRQPFTTEALQRLFTTAIYIDARKKGALDSAARNSKFWIPLIGLYTGMRLNEICQLEPKDITTHDEVAVIDVNTEADWKKLKTNQSARRIPIHEELIKMGLLDYAKNLDKKGEKLLFPDLTKSSTGSYSDNFSKWFNRFLKANNIKDKGLCFHSFRHTFRDALRHTDAAREIVAVLGGWKESDEAMDSYGKGYKLIQLQSTVNRIDCEVDFSALYL